METTRVKLAFGSYLWFGLACYVLCVDIFALLTGRETLSEAFGRAVSHPRRRWLATLSWLFTTKHLFFPKFLSWLDPFALMALFVRLIQRIFGGNK